MKITRCPPDPRLQTRPDAGRWKIPDRLSQPLERREGRPSPLSVSTHAVTGSRKRPAGTGSDQ